MREVKNEKCSLASATTDAFMRGLSASLLENPAGGAAQMINHVSGARVLPELKIFTERSYEFGSVEWHANTLGHAIGTATTVFMIGKGARGLLSTLSIGRRVAGSSTALGALAGSVYDGLAPVKESGDFWRQKAANTAAGALQFATLYGAGNYLGAPMAARSSGIAHQSIEKLVGGFAVGAAASIPGAQLRSLAAGNGFASGRELMENAYAGGLTGGALALAHHFDYGPAKRKAPEKRETSPAHLVFLPEQAKSLSIKEWRVVNSDAMGGKRLTGIAEDGAIVAIVDGHRVVKFAPGNRLAGAMIDKDGRVAVVQLANGTERILDSVAAEKVTTAFRNDARDRSAAILAQKEQLAAENVRRIETESRHKALLEDNQRANQELQREVLLARESKSHGGKALSIHSQEAQLARFYDRLGRGVAAPPAMQPIQVHPARLAKPLPELPPRVDGKIKEIALGLDRLEQRMAAQSSLAKSDAEAHATGLRQSPPRTRFTS